MNPTLDVEFDPGADLLVARLPRLICTEMLACDKSIPEFCRARFKVVSNLL
jgi:hypothetical protein